VLPTTLLHGVTTSCLPRLARSKVLIILEIEARRRTFFASTVVAINRRANGPSTYANICGCWCRRGSPVLRWPLRSSTANARSPSFTTAPLNCVFHHLRSLTHQDVIAAVRLLPDNQCTSDPLPRHQLKENIDVLTLIDRLGAASFQLRLKQRILFHCIRSQNSTWPT